MTQNSFPPTAFSPDERLTTSAFKLGDWPLSSVLLKNNADYPWFILVPRLENVQELHELPKASRHLLMDEISALSTIIQHYFKPDKLNVGTLGNIVPQLHIHVVARFIHDKLWPHGIWQAAQENTPYTDALLAPLLKNLRVEVNQPFNLAKGLKS